MKLLSLIVKGLCVGLFSLSVSAHNKVVVIPMSEDAPPIEALTPVAPAAPLPDNYQLIINNPITDLDDTVIDKTTGLEWQRVDDGGDGTNPDKDWENAASYCRGLNFDPPFAGKTGWRVPTISELLSIVYYGAINPAIDSAFFLNTKSDVYHSATTAPYFFSRPNTAIGIDFNVGSYFDDPAIDKRYVRCVRGEPSFTAALRDNGNGTVTDLVTALTWQQQNDGMYRNHPAAVSYCSNLSLGGKSDWRMPHIKELESIIDYRRASPSIDTKTFPNSDTEYWSATNDASGNSNVWNFDIDFLRNISRDKAGLFLVLCVRGGQ